MEEAVELQPATRQQVLGYLEGTGAALADVQAALEEDEALWELLSSPLVLHVVTLTYQDRSAHALRLPGGYIFVHRLLLDYFADLDTTAPPAAAAPPVAHARPSSPGA